MLRAIFFASILTGALFPTLCHAQGRLANVRREVREEKKLEAAEPSKTTEDPNETIAGSILGSFLSALFSVKDDNDEYALANAFKYGLFAPYYFPRLALNDNGNERVAFTPHPYFGAYPGYQILPKEDASLYQDYGYAEIPRRNWAVRTTVENGNDFHGLNRIGLQVQVDHASRFGLSTNWNFFHERLSTGGFDEIVVGDTNLTYRVARNEIASVYAGLGVRTLTDRKRTDTGVNFTYGGDWFPIRPIVVSTMFDAGTVGNTYLLHGRGTVGLMYHHVEFFGGYDFLRIGTTNLQGPLLGMRLWF